MSSISNPIKHLIKNAADDFAKDFAQIKETYKDENYQNSLLHAGEFGAARERIVSKLIRKFLPTQLGLGQGFVVNPDSDRTNQVDIVIYDNELTPKLEAEDARFYPYETVVALGEVKSILSRKALGEAIKKMRYNKDIRRCTPSNPFPLRPAGLSEAMVHHLSIVSESKFNQWGEFSHLTEILKKFQTGKSLESSSDVMAFANLVFNPKYFEELNFVTFLVCDEIVKFNNLTKADLKDMFFVRDVDNEHLGFNLILSIKDGLILHARDGNIPSPFPKHRNTKANLYIKNANGTDSSHIVMFISMLLHAVSSAAIFEFSPLPYMSMINLHDDNDPTMQLLFE